MKNISIDDFLKTLTPASAEFREKFTQAEELLKQIKSKRSKIERLRSKFSREEPDLVYRFYHQSVKVFFATNLVKQARELFEELAPENGSLNEWFQEITDQAFIKEFNSETNANWLTETRPVLEAMWHCRYFLDQMVIAADELETAPQVLPSGWAAVLYLYDLR